jgi:hypothetical protein
VSVYESRIDPTPDIVPGVHRLGSPLVNWYVVEERGQLTVVDAGLPAFRKRTVAWSAGRGCRARPSNGEPLTALEQPP